MSKTSFENLQSRLIAETSTDFDHRSEYLHDRDRILFSRSFRRLAGKTQVVTVSGLKTSDHIRSRLTHSLEVMQIASSIGNYLQNEIKIKINIDLIEAISLGHDLGHTPYGHVGERSLCDFLKNGEAHGSFPEKKLKHSFQSLKICCFLEKQYYPDYYGLNLTLSTLDGILKHSKIEESDREFYKKCFESYYPVFMEASAGNTRINEDSYETMKTLFDYCSPITLEGTIVSIADEIAQFSHDIEDLRRLTSFSEMLNFYNKVKDTLLNELCRQKMEEFNLIDIYQTFSKTLEDALNDNSLVMKVERTYTKLILSLSIPIVGNFIHYIWNIDENDRLNYLRQYYTGSFEGLLELSKQLSMEPNIQDALKCLDDIFKTYEKIPTNMKDIARWDLKGKEMCDELAEILYKALSSTGNEINLNIFDSWLRPHLKRSYQSGLEFGEKLGLSDSESIAKKCLIWDYVAGMTDSFIIKEYESFSFKRVEL
ncbi:MAG: dNTP triphosphohydrolase [Methanosarcina barkeri]|nr:dNTP triphosphohydrolase [Methanosarcina sp. ERenArc_MAG2]